MYNFQGRPVRPRTTGRVAPRCGSPRREARPTQLES